MKMTGQHQKCTNVRSTLSGRHRCGNVTISFEEHLNERYQTGGTVRVEEPQPGTDCTSQLTLQLPAFGLAPRLRKVDVLKLLFVHVCSGTLRLAGGDPTFS